MGNINMDESSLCETQKKKVMCKESGCLMDPYTRTNYKDDYCQKKIVLDEVPLDVSKPKGNLKCGTGPMDRTSTYIETFRSPSKVSVKNISLRDEEEEQSKCSKYSKQLYEYYFPPHCSQRKEDYSNCLTEYKDLFNLGLQEKPINERPEYSIKQSFNNHSTYRIEYCKKPFPPRIPSCSEYGKKIPPPLSDKTTHRHCYLAPSEEFAIPKKAKGRPSVLGKVEGHRLKMETRTTTIMDYEDPHVIGTPPFLVEKNEFKNPSCRMETQTNANSVYQPWKSLPPQAEVKRHCEANFMRQDYRNMANKTIYQMSYNKD